MGLKEIVWEGVNEYLVLDGEQCEINFKVPQKVGNFLTEFVLFWQEVLCSVAFV